jgi:hypothetical protein
VLLDENEDVSEMTEHQLLHYAFHKDRAIRLITGFLAFMATDPGFVNRGQIGLKIKAKTLRGKAECLWFYASWVLHTDAAKLYIPWKQPFSVAFETGQKHCLRQTTIRGLGNRSSDRPSPKFHGIRFGVSKW